MQVLESIKDLSKHRDSIKLHLGHKWFTHFGCVSGLLRFGHTFFGWGFILGYGAYEQSSFPGRLPSCFGHFVFMCSSSTFLFDMDNTSSFFFFVSFGGFWWESYACIWGHYGSKIMGVFSGPLSEALNLTTDIIWWYRPSFNRKLCPVCFSRELGFGGSVFVF